MPITIRTCQEDHEYEQYIRFFLKHRDQMTPPYPIAYAVQVLALQILKGHIIIGLDDNEEVMGSLAYYYGTPEQQFEDRQHVLIEVLLIKEEYRKTLAFMQGLIYLASEIEDSGLQVDQVLFYAHSESAYLKRLYSKFAKQVSKREAHLGEIDVYAIPFEQWLQYCRSLRRNM